MDMMRRAIIRYKTDMGEDLETQIDSSVNRVELEGLDIASIDLSALASMNSLEELSLKNNRMTQIDLRPLSHCRSLRAIDISFNRLEYIIPMYLPNGPQFESIDLSGTTGTTVKVSELIPGNELRWFYAQHNLLKELDLSWLIASRDLEYLVVSNNQIRHINLRPLMCTPRLRYLLLNNNPIDTLDVTPLFYLYDLEAFSVDVDVRLVADRRFRYGPDQPLHIAKIVHKIEWV